MLAPLLALALLKQPSTPAAASGSELFSQCQDEIKMMDSPESLFQNGNPNRDLLANAAHCSDFMHGFIAGAGLKTPKAFCVEHYPMTFVISSYVDYMKKHPELMDEGRAIGVRDALLKSFPCRVK